MSVTALLPPFLSPFLFPQRWAAVLDVWGISLTPWLLVGDLKSSLAVETKFWQSLCRLLLFLDLPPSSVKFSRVSVHRECKVASMKQRCGFTLGVSANADPEMTQLKENTVFS